MRQIEFTKETYDRFKTAYMDCMEETFMFDGIEVLKDYAKHVLTWLSPRFDPEAADKNPNIITSDQILYHESKKADPVEALIDCMGWDKLPPVGSIPSQLFFIEGNNERFGALQWGWKRELWDKEKLDVVKGSLGGIQDLIRDNMYWRDLPNPYAGAFGVSR